MFDPIAELFAPGRRHAEDELRRQALTREDPEDPKNMARGAAR
ncbi:DUF6191 domain-containing protein [Streptomyces narbonensis]